MGPHRIVVIAESNTWRRDYDGKRPVSYTHLDVYKRQGMGRWLAAGETLLSVIYFCAAIGYVRLSRNRDDHK